jgi:DUF4097 and DUF4098 domain-containing protein YvlB
MKRSLRYSILFIGVFIWMTGMAGTTFAQTRSLQVSKGGTLEVKLDQGDIMVTTSDRIEATVHGSSDGSGASAFNISYSGSTIRITNNHEGDIDSEDGVKITIPSQFNVHLETSYGDIRLQGKLVGRAEAETGAGEIVLNDVDGSVDIGTSGGDLRTGTVNGDGRLRTSGGNIDVQGTTGRLDVQTSGGDIQIGNVGKTLRANTSGGDVIIGDVGGEAKVATSGGNIRVGNINGSASLATSGGDIELNGGTGTISAGTSGGNLHIKNISGSVSASSSGGDVYAELRPSGKGRSKLITAAGNITLYLPDNAKATVDAHIRVQGYWRGQHHDYTIQSDFTADQSSQNKEEQEIFAHYTLNGGGEQITLETVNSDIQIRKLRSGQ